MNHHKTHERDSFLKRHTSLIITLFQYFYLLCAILLLVTLILTAVLGRPQIYILLPIIVTSIITYGLYTRKPWVTIVITILAALGIINNIVSPSNVLLMTLFSIAFLGFEIYFFNTKAVKAHLKTKNTTLY